MKLENQFKNVIMLGLISTSLKAADIHESFSKKDLGNELDENKIPMINKAKNKLVEIKGVKTWVTDDETINSLDLEPIKYKLITEDNINGLTLEIVDEIGEKYRAFLYLSKKYPNKNIVPSKEVDMFWHAHILDTYKYQQDCQEIFGKFFHHYPYFGMKDDKDEQNLEDSFNETLDLYRKEFPSNISKKMISKNALCIGEGSRLKALCIGEGVKAKALCIGEGVRSKALCIGEGVRSKALCIGEGTRTKALCIGEGDRNKFDYGSTDSQTSTINSREIKNDGLFEHRARPRFDRNNGEVIFQ